MASKWVGIAFIVLGIAIFILQGKLFFQDKITRIKSWAWIVFYFVLEMVCWFFASFGISDTAMNTLVYPFKDNVNIKLIPGTIVVGATIPMCFMSYSYLANSTVAPMTLILLIIAQAIGSTVGARVVTKMNEHVLRIVLGGALTSAAIMLTIKIFFLHSQGGNLQNLSTLQLIFMFFFMILTGVLAMVGFGSTIPNMAVLLTMGMPPLAIYPIIMSANCATCFAGCLEFIKAKAIHPQVVLIESIGGVIGVFFAMKFVANVNTSVLQVMMIIVMLISSSQMFRAEMRARKQK